MKITEADRRILDSNVLLLKCVSPFRVTARATVAQWLLNILKDARTGDTVGSTRAAVATWAMARGVSMETIMTAADWPCACTMRAHCLRLLPREALGEACYYQLTIALLVIKFNICKKKLPYAFE